MRATDFETGRAAWWLIRVLAGIILSLLGLLGLDIRAQATSASDRCARLEQTVTVLTSDLSLLRGVLTEWKTDFERLYETKCSSGPSRDSNSARSSVH